MLVRIVNGPVPLVRSGPQQNFRHLPAINAPNAVICGFPTQPTDTNAQCVIAHLNDREFHVGGCGGAAGTSGSRTTSGS